MAILDKRFSYAPFEYPKYYDYWLRQQQSHWLHSEVSMTGDLQDWSFNLTPSEKHLIGSVLKGFVQAETVVQDYWSRMVLKSFRKPEIAMMATAFASFEGIHAAGYAYLQDTLGLDDYAAFLDEPTAKAKIDRLLDSSKSKTKSDIARSLAIFSAFTEGVSLFSSFAVLFNFSRFNKMKGLSQIISWSVRDECFLPETEVLTTGGWRRIDEISITDKLAQFSMEDSSISFAYPLRIVAKKAEDGILRFKSDHDNYELGVTPNHDMVWKYNHQKTWSKTPAKDLQLGTKIQIPTAGYKFESDDKLTLVDRFRIATHISGNILESQDDSFGDSVPVVFSFSKNREVSRFERLLHNLNLEFFTTARTSQSNEIQITYTVKVPIEWGISKNLNWIDLDSVGVEWAEDFINEITQWSIHQSRDIYSSTNKRDVDTVQAIITFAGYNGTILKQEDNISDLWVLYLKKQSYKSLESVWVSKEDYNGNVFCATMPLGTLLVRYANTVSVSGNCLHSEAGCDIFRQLVSEYPEIWTDDLKQDILEAARVTIQLEDDFIEKAFELGDVEGLSAHDLKQFIRFRCNAKLQDLGLPQNWKNVDKDAIGRMEWFSALTAGASQGDFFAVRITDYAKGSLNFDDMW